MLKKPYSFVYMFGRCTFSLVVELLFHPSDMQYINAYPVLFLVYYVQYIKSALPFGTVLHVITPPVINPAHSLDGHV